MNEEKTKPGEEEAWANLPPGQRPLKHPVSGEAVAYLDEIVTGLPEGHRVRKVIDREIKRTFDQTNTDPFLKSIKMGGDNSKQRAQINELLKQQLDEK